MLLRQLLLLRLGLFSTQSELHKYQLLSLGQHVPARRRDIRQLLHQIRPSWLTRLTLHATARTKALLVLLPLLLLVELLLLLLLLTNTHCGHYLRHSLLRLLAA